MRPSDSPSDASVVIPIERCRDRTIAVRRRSARVRSLHVPLSAGTEPGVRPMKPTADTGTECPLRHQLAIRSAAAAARVWAVAAAWFATQSRAWFAMASLQPDSRTNV